MSRDFDGVKYSDDMKLIIGLGNPGKEYVNTRHNVGWMTVDAFATEEDGAWKKDAKRNAEICKLDVEDTDVVFAKPMTFMNLSGDAVQALVSFYKVGMDDVLIVHDEMDLPPGKIQFKQGGGDAGHNGVASIIERLGTDAFARLRIGIGRPEDPHIPNADYVLGELSPDHAPNAIDTTAAMRDWIEGGVKTAMNRWN